MLVFPVIPIWGTILWRRLGRSKGAIVLFFPPLAIGLTIGVGLSSILWALQWMSLGPVLAECLSRDWGIERAMGAALIGCLMIQGAVMAFWALEAAEAPWRLLQKEMEKIMVQASSLYMEREAAVSIPRDLIPELARGIVAVFPGLLASSNLILHWWNLLVQRRLPKLWCGRLLGPENLDEWALPFKFVWITIGGGLLILSSVDPLDVIGINLVLVMCSLHLIQGVAVVAFLMRRRGIPRSLRALVFGLIFVQHFMTLATAAIGVFDFWFDFRKRFGAKI